METMIEINKTYMESKNNEMSLKVELPGKDYILIFTIGNNSHPGTLSSLQLLKEAVGKMFASKENVLFWNHTIKVKKVKI